MPDLSAFHEFSISLPGGLDESDGGIVLSEGDGPELMIVKDDHGNQLGIQFNDDGTFTLGGWNADGEWVELRVATPCADGHCQMPDRHLTKFALDQHPETSS